MTAGRPPKPQELKKAQGTYRADRDKSIGSGNVIRMNPVIGVPEIPDDLGLPGQNLWNKIFKAEASWIQNTDLALVEAACRMADLADSAMDFAKTAPVPQNVRAAVQASNEYVRLLSELGFTPVARTKMGVQTVQAESTLEKLMRKKNG